MRAGAPLKLLAALAFATTFGLLVLPLSGRAAKGLRTAAGAPFNKVFTVVLENEAEQDAIQYPFMKRLASEGALLANYSAVTHPSYPNYLALTAGSTFDIRTDFQRTIDARHVGDLLEAKGKTWRVYAEDYPGGRGRCFLGSSSGAYARKHVPFLSYRNVQDGARCAHVVNAHALADDVAAGSLPDYSFYVPNLDNDGHDTDLAYADHFLATTFGPLLADPRFTDGLLFVVTFDEDDGDHANRIYTVLWGAGVRAGAVSEARWTHYDLLRTIEDAFGLGTLGREDASAKRISGIWR